MSHDFKRGDRVRWNSEAGEITGIVLKKVTMATEFRGRTRHASKEEPQYLLKSEKTGREAMHKGSALRKVEGEKS